MIPMREPVVLKHAYIYLLKRSLNKITVNNLKFKQWFTQTIETKCNYTY